MYAHTVYRKRIGDAYILEPGLFLEEASCF
jgi:hypothetical protein